MLNERIQILLVEDDDIYTEAIIRAFRRHKIANLIHRARHGSEALDMLRGTAGYTRLPRPYLILTDLSMPRMNGLEMIWRLRADSLLKDSVVFVLTSQEGDEAMMEAYDLGVAGYFTKHMIAAAFAQVIQLLDLYQPVIQLPPLRRRLNAAHKASSMD